MNLFLTTLNQMLILATFIITGIILRKKQLLPEGSHIVFSRLENYVLVPSLIINTFSTRFTIPNLTARYSYIIYGFIILCVCFIMAFLVAPLLSKNSEETDIYRYSIVCANFAFFGNALIQGIFGEDMLFDYLIYTLPLNLFTYSIGYLWLTSKNKKFTFKKLLNPNFLALIIGGVFGLFSIRIPSILSNALSSASACFSPIAMILTGYVIGGFEFKKLFSNKTIYLMTFLRLLLIPAFIFTLLILLKADSLVILLAVCSVSMPLGLNTIIFPASCGKDVKLGASMVLISSIASLITIPLVLALIQSILKL